MKTSELLLRAIANEKGIVSATRFDEWLLQLVGTGFIETNIEDEKFYYRLTDKSKQFLRKKGIEL